MKLETESEKNKTDMLICADAKDTITAGKKFGETLEPGTAVYLYGSLGSGKTTFVKGIAESLSIGEEVTSPTFTIIQQYTGTFPLFHIDLYRITSIMELEELGMDDIFDGRNIIVIEWPEKMSGYMPEKLVRVRFSIREDLSRVIKIERN
jgi:tRNA threonylcarbamoyladenosine biosynthesis protein TsaE